MKRTLLAMALLLTSVFGVTGCGSDDDVQAESRVKNVAPEASGVSDALSEADCDRGYEFLNLLDRLDRLDPSDLDDYFDLRNRGDILDLYDVLDRLDFYDLYDRHRDQCAAASKSGNYAPEGDDVDGG